MSQRDMPIPRRLKLLVAAAGLALAVAACTGDDQTGASTVPVEETSTTTSTTSTSLPTTTAPSSTSTEPTTGEPADVSQVGCEDAPESVAIVCEAYELIKARYVDDIDDATLALAAIQGLETLGDGSSGGTLLCAVPSEQFASSCDTLGTTVSSSDEGAEAVVAGLASFALDPNSAYLDSQALALIQEEQQGEIEGIGALVSPEDETIPGDNKQCSLITETCQIVVASTIDGAPARAAGLEPDDIIVGVDGESIEGWTVDEVTAAVRGPAGTDVTLDIRRGGERLQLTITRAAVIIPVIESEMVGDTGYVRLRVFNQSADEQFEEAVGSLLDRGAETLVVDLRDNPGGLLDTAIAVTSVFTDEGEVVVTQGPDDSISYSVTGETLVPDDVEVVFIVNRGSASASEVVSAALQEQGRVRVIGEHTFGKNTVQQRFALSNGGALKLTIARWLTPGGLDFGGVGVTPDAEVEIGPDLEPEEIVELAVSGQPGG